MISEDDKPWVVFVSGSRDLVRTKHTETLLDGLEKFMHSDLPMPLLIHGAGSGRAPAEGCDRIAHLIAQQWGWRIFPVPALWSLQDKVAGPIRNNLCAMVLLAHERAGYRAAFRGFSTGGAGTEGAAKVTRELFEKHGRTLDYQKIDVPLG